MTNRKPLVMVNSYPKPMRSSDTLTDGDGVAFATVDDLVQPGCRVWSNSSLLVATSTFVAIPFNQERHDPGGMHDVATNNTRITVPRSGSYHIGANLYIYPETPLQSGIVVVWLRFRRLDGTYRWIASQSAMVPSSYSGTAGDFVWHCAVSGVTKMEAGEYAECAISNFTGGNITVVAIGVSPSTTRLQYFQDFFVQRIAD